MSSHWYDDTFAYLPTCLPACLPAYLPAWLSVPVWLPACLPVGFLAGRPVRSNGSYVLVYGALCFTR